MPNISSLTPQTGGTNSSYSAKGMSGLVSGMDTDSMVENMTAATRSKIAKQSQDKTTLSWKTDAYRSISTPLIEFSNKYMSYASSTNLFSSGFFSQNSITTSGANSKYVSVSGSSPSANAMTIDGVKQLAKDASFVTTKNASAQTLETGTISFGTENTSSLSGKNFTIKYGADSYTVSIPENETDPNGIYTTGNDNLATAINAAMKKVDLGTNPNGTRKTLADVATVTMADKQLTFKSNETDTNTIKITGGSDGLLADLGLTSMVDQSFTTGGVSGTTIDANDLKTPTTMQERWLNKSMSFQYNGTTKSIAFTADDLATVTDLSTFQDVLQKKLNDNFGNGRITVANNATADGFAFQTTLPDGSADNSSILKITGGSGGLFGTSGALHINAGASNRLNLNAPLKNCGLKNGLPANQTFGITINSIPITGETLADGSIKSFDANTSIADIIRVVNSNSKAGVQISYSESNDKFTVSSTQKGASGKVAIDETAPDLGTLLFGDRTETLGQDAKVLIDYDGGGGQAAVEVVRDSNTFNLDGLNISVNGTFGYSEAGIPIASEAIKMTAKPETDKIVDAVKQMVIDYNKIVDEVNSSVKEKHDRKYPPLTDEQKKGMSEDQIKTWEEKAKKGMLFGDNDLFNLSNELRFVFSSTRSDGLKFSDIGLNISSTYSDNGKITIDETKLKASLEERPNDVQKLFANSSNTTSLNDNGVMAKLKSITDKYARTTGATKGILIEKAGHSNAPISLLKNTLQTKMDNIDKMLKTLNASLKTEQTRYQKQFTSLEQLIAKMNAQSSYFNDL